MGTTKALTFSLSNHNLAEAIKRNDSKVLKELYQHNFDKVKAYVLQNSGNQDQAKDLYQDAFIALWKNVKDNKFEPKNANELGAYLFTIAKNKWLDTVRSKRFKSTVKQEENHLKLVQNDENEPEIGEKQEKLNKVLNALKDLEKGCRELLSQFYFEKKSMQQIGEDADLDPASARNKKYRCMQKLRALALKSN